MIGVRRLICGSSLFQNRIAFGLSSQDLRTHNHKNDDTVNSLINDPRYLALCAIDGFKELQDLITLARDSQDSSKRIKNLTAKNIMNIYQQILKDDMIAIPNIDKFVTLSLNTDLKNSTGVLTDMMNGILQTTSKWSIDTVHNRLRILSHLVSFTEKTFEKQNFSAFDAVLSQTLGDNIEHLDRIDSLKIATFILGINKTLRSVASSSLLTKSVNCLSLLVPQDYLDKAFSNNIKDIPFDELVQLLDFLCFHQDHNVSYVMREIEERISSEPMICRVVDTESLMTVRWYYLADIQVHVHE